MATYKLTTRQKSALRKAFPDELASQLAQKTKWNKNLIAHYKNGTKVVSPQRAIIIELLIGVPREVLRPDIFIIKKSL